MKKQIITGEKAKEQLLEGAKLLYEAVSATLGPKGQNAVIEAFGEPIVTHDGVTVAKAIEDVLDASPGARVGIEMIKSSSSKTNDNVGDGTTSSTILAYHLMQGGMDKIKAGKNPMVLRKEIEAAKEVALKKLGTLAEPLKTEKQAIEVATISSENKEIGKQVGHMYHVLGKDGMVVVEIGTKPETEYEIVEGYTFDRGVVSPMMILDTRTQTTTVKNPAILIAHETVGLRDIAELCDELYNLEKDGLVIICDDFKNDLLDESLLRLAQGDFEIIGIKAPGFGDNRIELLKDIAAYTGGKVFGNKLPLKASSAKAKDLGTCDELVVTANETILTGGKDVTEYVKDLTAQAGVTKGEFDKSKVEKRIAQLHAKVGQIRVGGHTEMEAEERKYLIDDAVAATEAALKEGIVPGGGTTYIELSRAFDPENATEGQEVFVDALLAPFKVLMANAGERYGAKMDLVQPGKGFDVMGDGSLVDLREHGIIDPAMVIRQAITNAVSVAGSALTTGVLITTEKEKNEKEEV